MEKSKSPRSSGRISKKRPSKSSKMGKNLNAKRWKSDVSANKNENAVAASSSFPVSILPSTSSSTPASDSKQTCCSTSEKKLGAFNQDGSDSIQVTDGVLYSIIHRDVWAELLKEVCCSICYKKSLCVQFVEQKAFASKIELRCTSCGTLHNSMYSSPRLPGKKSFDVNRRVVQSFLSVGKGSAAVEKFSLGMSMNTMDTKTFTSHMKQVAVEAEELKEEVLEKAREAVRKAHEAVAGNSTSSGVLDIAVSYDGTWQKRGHSSLYGIGFVVDILTGLVIDFEVLSKYCHLCTVTKSELGENSPDFEIWFEGHKPSCDKNYDNSSNSMEVAIAEILWKRSESECKMRYTIVLSDGDSKAYQHVQDLNIYGDQGIEKEECINHVAKRLGTGLRNIVKEWKVKKVTLGGRAKGSLKEATIKKLQQYYRCAIKNNIPNVSQTKSAIFATLKHCMSTDAKPLHQKCPGGPDSWCFFNRSIANGETPQRHDAMKVSLNGLVVEKIMPVYQRLASDELIRRCCRGQTQNTNESLHSVVWSRCSKEVFVSKKRLSVAVVSAVSNFNMGCTASMKMSHSVLKANSEFAAKIGKNVDERRIRNSRRKSDKRKQLAKQYIKKINMANEKAKIKAEGVTYGAGKF